MNSENTFEELASVLGVSPENLAGYIGDNWSNTSANPNLLIRGNDFGFIFFDDDFDDEGTDDEDTDESYPDVGILVELPDLIHVGTLKALYNPAPSGYEIKPMVTLSGGDELALEKLVAAIESAAEKYKAKFKTCKYCKKKLPPYVMSERGYCYGCGSSELGLIY